jgi:hypothetical protein
MLAISEWPTIKPKFVYRAGIPLAPGKILQELSNSPFPKRLRDEQAYSIRLTGNPGKLKGV